MERSAASLEAEDAKVVAPRTGRDWKLLILLLVLAAGLRTWVVSHTEVMARDSIVFIDYALQLEDQPWQEVLLGNHQHPGYPLSVLAVSWPIRQIMGRTDCVSMQASARASALAGVLLVVPMFFLGRLLFNSGAAFWATLLFQCLPVSGKILSDGLSESLFMLLTATALLMAVQGVRSGAAWRFALCGVFAGLAYLTRPEGVVVVAGAGLFLLVMQMVPGWRRGWAWTLASGACLGLSALAAGSPYYLATGQLTNKPSGKSIVQTAQRDKTMPQPPVLPVPGKVLPHDNAQSAADGSTIFVAVWLNKDLGLPTRLGTGILAVLNEIMRGFHYVGWLPALLGLWWHRRRLQARPEAWLIGLVVALHSLILWRLAMVAGYVSERHVVLLVMFGLLPAVACLQELPARFVGWLQKMNAATASALSGARIAAGAPGLSVVLVLVLAGMGLSKTLQPLHANRAGHHAAGLWLARHVGADDEVCDSHFGWAKYYAGRAFPSARQADHLSSRHATRYVVKGSSLERVNPYGPTNAIADMTEKEIEEYGGKPVYHWPERATLVKAKVIVWAVPLPLKRQ